MRRPQSAKPGYKGYWGQGSQSQLQQQQSIPKGYRKNVKLMKPDLTTNDFARILPKKIYQDKQRLYSEALQLKQNLNETHEQNIRLKTRITILEKEKDKMTKHLQVNQQKGGMNKANSRVNIYNNKPNQKENMMIRNLKKLVRQGKQENEFLKQENAKIKKAIKYTKINEIEIEKKMLLEQNKRIVNLIEDMNKQLLQQDDFVREINDLKRKIEYQEEAYSQVREANQKYEQYIQQLEQKRASQIEKTQVKENKLQREIAINKRKLNQVTRQAQDLKRQLNNLRLGTSSIKTQSNTIKGSLAQSKIDSQKPKLTRPMSSNPYKSQGLVGVRMTTQTKKQEDNKQNQQLKNIQLENQQLKQELSRAKLKLQQTERQKEKENQSEQKQTKEQNKKNASQKRLPENNFMDDKKVTSRKQIKSTKQEKAKQKQNKEQDDEQKYYNDAQENYDDDYSNEFEQNKQEKSIKIQSKLSNPKEDTEIDQYRKDFQAQEEQQPLYVKENESKKKKDDKKKKEKKQTAGYKPNKKLLSQMKELLTYRMKAQRYPYEELKKDIESAKQQQFALNDLKGMFLNEPFYLTEKYVNILLQYCFESQNPKPNGILSNQALLTKLRKVIEDFELIDEKEEQEMLLRIAQMVTEYPQELETAFEKIKNGEETVAKEDLIEMFQNLQLQHKYIELIIQQLSLCSSDIDHLNFIGFFERFYVENMSGLQNGQIDEQQMQSSSEQVTKNLKSKDSKKLKQVKAEFQDNDYNLEVDDGQRISLGGGDKYEDDNNDDVVSDDGPI